MSSFRRLPRAVLRSVSQRSGPLRARRLKCERLEVRRLLAAEGSPFEFSGLFDAAGVVGNVSAEVRWGDGTTSAPTSISGGATSNQLRIRFDYSLDTSGFFSGAGQPRRQILELAAESIVGRFADDLTAIVPGGLNEWQPAVFHPSVSSGNQVEGPLTDLSPNLSVPANEIIVYVGARDLPGDRRGVGGGGSFSFPAVEISCRTQAECDQTIADIEAFRENVRTRGEAGADGPVQTDVAPNVGSVSFDNQTDWYFGVDAHGIQPGQVDFMSVAIHELAHVLGFGISRFDITSAWDNLTSSGSFSGPKARAAYLGSGNVPVDGTHWGHAVTDEFGQATVMGETIFTGSRQLFSPLDFAAMDDLGWELIDSHASVSANHVYADNGSYPVELVLRGSRTGEVVHALNDATVTNVEPTLTSVANQSVVAGSPLQITNIGQISDPGFANSAANPATVETFDYFINWGDGSAADTGQATIDATGSTTSLTLASFDGNHTYDSAGTRTVTLRVTDDDGGAAEASFTVTVAAPPALSLELSTTSVREDDGDGAATLTVRRSGPVRATNQTITLGSSNSDKATVPSSVVIPAGSNHAEVDVRAIDDALLLGDVGVTLSASADGVDDDTIELLVRDHESLSAEFSGDSLSESNSSTVQLTLRRSNTDVGQPLNVQVDVDERSETDLPSTVSIPAGEQQVIVNVAAIDDNDPEAPQTLTFTFLASGYESGAAVIEILDNEAPLFQNPNMTLDVNDSGAVTASDALRVINQLAIRDGTFTLDPNVDQPNGIFLDTNGDYRVTAVDALRVINGLENAPAAAEAEQVTDDEENEAVDAAIGLLF